MYIMSLNPKAKTQKRCANGTHRGPDGNCYTLEELAALRAAGGRKTRKKQDAVIAVMPTVDPDLVAPTIEEPFRHMAESEPVAEPVAVAIMPPPNPATKRPRKQTTKDALPNPGKKQTTRRKKKPTTDEMADQVPAAPVTEGIVNEVANDIMEPGDVAAAADAAEETDAILPEQEHAATEEAEIQRALEMDVSNGESLETYVHDMESGKQMNLFLKDKERVDVQDAAKRPLNDPLYPQLNDPQFNLKIALRKEFNDTHFDGTIQDIEHHANELCSAKFELAPHQLFVRNFLSLETPYQSLLLYHGLGTGKTCSAIGVAEEMRAYMKQVGLKERILIVASPNVQGNFRQQLFDERKLEQIPHPTEPNEFVWNIESCVGNSLLEEINPTGFQQLPRAKVISNIMTVIHTYYEFIGYGQFANLMSEKIGVISDERISEKEKREIEIYNIRRAFNNRLIVIDEVHNIRLTEENANKTAAILLMKVAKYSENLRLLLLSATPMYNSYKEIIWLTNLMNLNDGRPTIETSDVFDATGQFKPAGKITAKHPHPESGDDLLRRKLTGYVSYVRGENPYTFPYRIYPSETTFAKENSLDSIRNHYPKTQMNGKPIDQPLRHIRVYLNRMDTNDYQSTVYQTIIRHLRTKSANVYLATGKVREMPSFENMDAFGYTLLQMPLESLNMVYPSTVDIPFSQMEDAVASQTVAETIGKNGLANTMIAVGKDQFDYRPAVVAKFGRVFHPDQIAKYSRKIATICDAIRKSEGIVLVYSQYIDSGIIPLALALEEMGITRHGSSNLFATMPTSPVDAITMKPRTAFAGGNADQFAPAKYIMITGDKTYSPNNTAEVKYATDSANQNGSLVKVILISKAGSEGLDFKCIRQIHVLEPWYNMNRIEQIIGRGVRNMSHCGLPFEKRNVQIYLHGTVLGDGGDDMEAADMYVYRLTERKSLQIGRVSRTIKEIAVDCHLNIQQTNFTVEKLMSFAKNKQIQQRLSDQSVILFPIGDQPFTDICDYMDTCEYQCRPATKLRAITDKEIQQSTYSETFALGNRQAIAQRIRHLYRDRHMYTRRQLVAAINVPTQYPMEQIFAVLSLFLKHGTTGHLVDAYGRKGYLVNRGEHYAFQPVEISDETISMVERMQPVKYYREQLTLELPKEIRRTEDIALGEIPETSVAEVTDDNRETVVIEPSVKKTSNRETKFHTIVAELEGHFEKAMTEQEVKQGNKDWYMHCSRLQSYLESEYQITAEQYAKYVAYHAIDMLMPAEKHALLEVLYGSARESVATTTPMMKYLDEYFDERIMKSADGSQYGIVLTKNNAYKLWMRPVADTDAEWTMGGNLDYDVFKTDLKKKYVVPAASWNILFGFIAEFKEKEMVFKIKDSTQSRGNTGARCDSAKKSDILKKLNELLDEPEKYTTGNTEHIFHTGICVLVEMIMREFTRTKRNGKVYFFTAEQAAFM